MVHLAIFPFGTSEIGLGQARLTGFLLRPYDVVVLLYQAKLLRGIGLFIGLSFCLRFDFGIYLCQPETGYHNSDSCLFKIS